MELNARVSRAVRSDLAHDAHDRVLHRHALAGLARERDLDGLRYAEPGPAEGEGHGDVGRSHPRAERADRTVRIRVRVAADDHGARFAVTLLHHDLVAHALARVVEGRDPLCPHPLAEDPMRVRDDRCRSGRGVVDEDGDFRRVPHALSPEVAQTRDDRVDDRVVHHDARHRNDDEVAGLRVARGDPRQDLLGDGLRQRPTHEAGNRADPSTAGRSRPGS